MGLVNFKTRVSVLVIFIVSVFCTGCATYPVVEPTLEELEAARAYKKTVAILEFSDDASTISGIKSAALPKLENLLAGHFNVVEREKIKQVMAERDFETYGDVERINELGKLLGVDYVIFGNALVSVTGPELKHRESEYKGKFYGRIWEESHAHGEVSIKMVDVSNGMILYADKKRGSYSRQDKAERFKDQALFNQTLRNRSVAHQIIQIVGSFTNLKKEHSLMVSKALENAVRGFNYDLRNKFAHSGEVLQILSHREVVINLGSAYGIKPGDTLIVWEEKAPIKDPKTGILTVPKEKRATLKVIKVTSGLTCVAKGSKRAISQIKIGDKVFTH